MDAQRALVRVLGRMRQLPAGDALRGVYPPYVPVYRQDGSYIPIYRRDGLAQGVAAYVPAYNADGEVLQLVTDGSFNATATKAGGAVLTVVAAVQGTTRPTAYQFANLAAFPAIGTADRLYVALDTNLEFSWGGNAYIQTSEVSAITTDGIAEGAVNLYFTAARVVSTVLTGLAAGTNAAITAADTLLQALAKLQAQLDNKLAVTGNAASATKLVTARTINGVAFDGTANIIVADGTKMPLGSNAASATKLQTARTINGVPFDGTTNISLPASSPFTVSFTGTGAFPAPGGTLSFSHGLGTMPKLIRVTLRCDVSEGNWPVGSEIDVSNVQYTASASRADGVTVGADTGTIWVQVGNGTVSGVYNVVRYSLGTGVANYLTIGFWTTVVRAYA